MSSVYEPGAGTPRFVVRVFAPPLSQCADGKSWRNAAEAIFARVVGQFGDQVGCQFVELFSPEFFQFPRVMAYLEDESTQAPIITVDDEIIQSGGKISEKSIREALIARGLVQTS